MSEPIVRQEFFRYDQDNPFHIYRVGSEGKESDRLFNHWHPELEIAYNFRNLSHHYIDGQHILSRPGRLVVTNSESIHSIIVEPDGKLPIEETLPYIKNIDDETVTLVVIISREFLKENFPEYDDLMFLNNKEIADEKILRIFEQLYSFADGVPQPQYAHLKKKSLIMELLYLMCCEGIAKRNDLIDINAAKNIERMKGVITFINQHYDEHITQAAVSEKFYFTTVYFSRYFKKCTGMTFTEYLTKVRVDKAESDLKNTDLSISEIAMKNGFSDDRRLIIAFKNEYKITPLQYRKSCRS